MLGCQYHCGQSHLLEGGAARGHVTRAWGESMSLVTCAPVLLLRLLDQAAHPSCCVWTSGPQVPQQQEPQGHGFGGHPAMHPGMALWFVLGLGNKPWVQDSRPLPGEPWPFLHCLEY